MAYSNQPPVKTVVQNEDYPIQCDRFGVALSWDPCRQSQKIDLDLQAVAFDNKGKLLDAVYYNNMKALGRGMTHSGDETSGDKAGFDEAVWINLTRLPPEVQLIAIVVACYSGGHLRDARNGFFHLLQDPGSKEVRKFQLEASDEEVDLVGALIRTRNGWVFRLIEEPAQDGQHFMDILEPTIGNLVRKEIPGAPKRIKACFAMNKGSVVDLPRSSEVQEIQCALGWDTTQGEVDLDVSAILLDKEGRHVETVFFSNLEYQGVRHSGDNLTGYGDGDDEIIYVNLVELPSHIEQIAFVINIYTGRKSFRQVANPYCRVLDSAGEEMCKFQLREAGDNQALIISRLFREPAGVRWGFQAIGQPSIGTMWKDTLPDVMTNARVRPTDLQRGMTTTTATAYATPASAPISRPQMPAQEKQCTVQ